MAPAWGFSWAAGRQWEGGAASPGAGGAGAFWTKPLSPRALLSTVYELTHRE